jgi:hypothetical protein
MEEAILSKRAVAWGAGAGAGIGYAIGKLTGGDVKDLLKQVIAGAFDFLHAQGAYASFAIVMAAGCTWLTIWVIKAMITSKQEEIDRAVAERG